MSLTHDFETIVETVLPVDPSFRRIDQAAIDSCVSEVRRRAEEGCKEAFLLAAMRLLALPNNGHTRLIPNDAISVLPLRFVSVGSAVHLIGAAPNTTAPKGELIAVNGAPVRHIEAAAEKFLAGTWQRKRVIGALLFAWPYALAQLGFPSKQGSTEYRIQDGKQVTDFALENGQMVPASTLYPRNEHGRADPDWEPQRFVELAEWPGVGLSMGLPSFFDPTETALPQAVAEASQRVRASADTALLIDLGGNTGGDFLKTLPLIDAITEDASRQVGVLVDKFTFSAAIVFVAILKHRLGPRLKLIGEEMGDGLVFHAEGGLLNLPTSGAVVRYATAFHDWESGHGDDTTPPEIAKQMVAAGALKLDWEWTALPMSKDERFDFHQRVLKSLNGQRSPNHLYD
ncbi:MAG: peptidase S41 [Pseudomonadota bacterium]